MKRLLPLLALTLLTGCSYLGLSSSDDKTAMTAPADAATTTAPAAEATPPAPQPTLAVADAWAAVMPKGAKVAAGYFTVANSGADADRIVSVTSPVAGRVEVHEMAKAGSKMKMRPVKGGVAVPAGGSVAFNQTGMHLMFLDIKKPFAEGDTVPVTITFEKGGTVDVALSVKAQGSGGQP